MLSDRHCQLLTAYVDGVLSARRRKLVLKLLRKVPDARQLLKELEQNAQGLRRLPVVKPGPGFAAQVVRALESHDAVAVETQPLPSRLVPSRRLPRQGPAWAAAAAAAAILAAITFGSYLFFSHLGQQGSEPFVENGKEQTPAPKTKPHPLVNSLIAGANEGYNRPVGLPLAMADLSKPATQALLTKKARQDGAVHVDLKIPNDGKAGKRLVYALAASKIKLFVDPAAAAQLDSGSAGTEYVVYAENLKPEDLAAILGKFGSAGKTAAGSSVRVSALSESHRGALAKMLGVEAQDLPAPPMDLLNPISAPPPKGKKDKGGNPDQITPSATQEPLAMVMVLASGGAAARSAQVQQFIRSRSQLRPGTLQVVFVIHQA